MEKTQIEKIIRLGKKHTYQPADESYLNQIERNLYRVLAEEPLNATTVEVLAKFLFERKKYKESLSRFKNLLKINPDKINAYYGMYKCYIMLNDYEKAYNSILKYIENKQQNGITLETGLIFSAYKIIFNNDYSHKVSDTDHYLMNQITDQELKTKYQELVEAYNSGDYSNCLILAEECEKICRSKHIKIEFCTLKQLLNQVNIVTKEYTRNNLPNYYKALETAITDNDFMKIIQILNNIPKTHLLNDKIVYNAIYILIKNDFLKEAQTILSTLISNKRNTIIINTLENAINNQIEYNALSEIEKENYQTAIQEGHDYYQEGNLEYAYYTYKFGEYTTNNHIFLYYIGKILFKLGRYRESEEYLKNYIKIGSDKAAKAYLYLASIYRNRKEYKKAGYYGEQVDILNKIFATDYLMYFIYDGQDEKIDFLKMKLQEKDNMYVENFEVTDNELYLQIIACLQNGQLEEANKLIKIMEQNPQKTAEDKYYLRMIKKNKKIHQQKAKRKTI